MSTADKTTKDVLQEISEIAMEGAVSNGARRETVAVVEMEMIPLQVSDHLPYWISS